MYHIQAQSLKEPVKFIVVLSLIYFMTKPLPSLQVIQKRDLLGGGVGILSPEVGI